MYYINFKPRIIQKLKSISDKQNVILKRLSYLLHVKLLYLSRFVQIDFRIILG